MIKKIFLYGSITAFLGASITIFSLTVTLNKIKSDRATMKQHYEAQLEILKHPKEKKDEKKEIIKLIYKDEKGDNVIVEKTTTKTITEKEPVLLDAPNTNNNIRQWYVSGAYGCDFKNGFSSYGFGLGYNIANFLSAGIRFDSISQNKRIGIELRIDF